MSRSAGRRARRKWSREQGQKASRQHAKVTGAERQVKEIDKRMKIDFDAYVRKNVSKVNRIIALFIPPPQYVAFVAVALGYIPPAWFENLLSPAQGMDNRGKMKPLSFLQWIQKIVGFLPRVFFIVLRKVLSVLLVEWMMPIRRAVGCDFISGKKKIDINEKSAELILTRFWKPVYRKSYTWH